VNWNTNVLIVFGFSYRCYMKSILTAFLLTLATTTQVWAWGSEGHRIVAEIAEQYLEPETAHQIRDLLAIENTSGLADVANWADQIRQQRRDTASWHFVDIPINAAGYDATRDCPRNDCVVAKTDEFVAQLRDRSLPARPRLEALKFVVHFIGDIHQPLHAADNGDRGGNEIHVRYPRRKTNLHAVWDSGILEPVVRGDDRDCALYVAHQITPLRRRRGAPAAPSTGR
jgi:hypothetical protein